MSQNPEIVINTNDLVQSPYTYIQTSGSTGVDGSTEGIHLRWDFRKLLGDLHLPKGNLAEFNNTYANDSHFYRANDFVKVYKVPYIKKFPTKLNLATQTPNNIISIGSNREWEFDILLDSITTMSISTTIVIKFSSFYAYDVVAASIDPNTEPYEFLKAYSQSNGHIEVKAKDKLSFAVTFISDYIDPLQSGILQTEAISTNDKIEDEVISCRKTFSVGPKDNVEQIPFVDNTGFMQLKGHIHRIEVENIKYIRFKTNNIVPYQFLIETYFDFITGTNEDTDLDWQALGEFSLSDNDNTVFERLEGPSGAWNIDNNWPRFINNKKVSTANYRDKWRHEPGYPTDTDERIKEGVIKYMENSNAANPLANLMYQYETQPGEPTNGAYTEISYLDMLKVVSHDYHIARMLGLGHIDAFSANTGQQKFIYLMLYDTDASLEVLPALQRTHYYMTMPTSILDECLPDEPELKPVEYGLTVPATPTPILLTDSEGYLPYHDIRYIQLYRKLIVHELDYTNTFYESSNEFCTKGTTETLFYGLEYKAKNDPAWLEPTLSHDTEYDEIIPLPNPSEDINTPVNDIKPVYIHAETNEGIHEYALYGINWFSRPSTISNIKITNATAFPLRNTLLPPSKFAVQLIQKEQPRVFTTIDEQTRLADLNSSSSEDDEILVRATFYWNHVHYNGYQFEDEPNNVYKLKAEEVQLFFRQNAQITTRGVISEVVDLPENKAKIKLGSYDDLTQNPHITYTPQIITGTDYRFFNSNNVQYVIDIIDTIGTDIFVTVHKHVETDLTETQPDEFAASQVYTAPVVGDYFSINEYLQEPNTATWPLKLSEKVSLVNFETSIDENGISCNPRIHKETRTGMENQDAIIIMGGIFESASITEVLDIDTNGDNIANSRTGIFTIEFSGNPLSQHPDYPNVEWYKGTVRTNPDPDPNLNPNFSLPDYELDLEEKKVLEVVNIDSSGPNLVLTVVDSSFEVDPNSSTYELAGTYQPIETGTNILVNFHPGYRAYFTAETGFDQTEILPAPQTGSRKTYMGSNSIDNNVSLESRVSTPALLNAIEIVPPLSPGLPSGPSFATRPDFYGKSTYTFDAEVEHTSTRQPFALLFFRANERSILDTLYSSTKIDTILSNIEALTDAEKAYMPNYWNALVNADITSGAFTDPLDGTSNAGIFQFPIPNNEDYIIPGTTTQPFDGMTTMAGSEDIVKKAILGAFLPLTEQPIIYGQLETGRQTRKNKPVLYDETGNRLQPTDTSFDPFPMVVKFDDGSPNKWTTRFTDYTIDGASTSIYFYYGVEMSNMMQLSENSPVAGPISLINAFPPEPPQIRKVKTNLANPVLNIDTSVQFEINKYLPADKISGIQVYRAIRVEDTKSIRTMKLVKTLEQDLLATPPITFNDIQAEIIDDFSDVAIPLYGETLYYRLVALREIINEQGLEENIPSQPSNLMLTSLVDVLNPEAPEITYESEEINGANIIPNVLLKWDKTVHNGTYYLYKMNTAGNWELVETIQTNDEHVFYNVGDIEKEDSDGNTIYTRYRVKVENASGLLNLSEKELTI